MDDTHMDNTGKDGKPMNGAPVSGAPINGTPVDGTPMSGAPTNGMQEFMHNAFWLKDRISLAYKVTFQAVRAENVPSRLLPPFINIAPVIASIDVINANIIADTGYSLEFFSDENRDHLPPGAYLFNPVPGSSEASLIIFMHLKKNAVQPAIPETSPVTAPSDENGKLDEGSMNDAASVPILQIVNKINTYIQPDGQQGSLAPDLASATDEVTVALSSSAPAYFCGATDQKPQGCPLTPPIPVESEECCSSSPGLWPITLRKIPRDVQAVTGDGVTVFVLDTLPKYAQIKRAVEGAGEDNLLLLDVFNNATFRYPQMMDGLDDPGPSQGATGKDVHGKLVGFRMPDHGLFIAGMIRDVAPDANIECVRVLNDFCVGSVQSLIAALSDIQSRMLQGGDLYDEKEKQAKPVVINLSLVIPDDNEVLKQVDKAGIPRSSFHLDMAREALLKAIQSLIELGAVFVASAGNEGDDRFVKMSTTRPNALYPAQYAYKGLTSHAERMIPVGAVDRHGKVTTYSCYPGAAGFATYGGDVPQAVDIKDGQGKRMTTIDVEHLDAPIGIYTSLFYPAFSVDDPQARYTAPNAHCWAYWVGTSFATPIVSAVAARMLEYYKRNPSQAVSGGSVPPIVALAAKGKTTWTNIDAGAASSSTGSTPDISVVGPVILASQCKPTVAEEEDEDEAEEMGTMVPEMSNVPVVESVGAGE